MITRTARCGLIAALLAVSAAEAGPPAPPIDAAKIFTALEQQTAGGTAGSIGAAQLKVVSTEQSRAGDRAAVVIQTTDKVSWVKASVRSVQCPVGGTPSCEIGLEEERVQVEARIARLGVRSRCSHSRRPCARPGSIKVLLGLQALDKDKKPVTLTTGSPETRAEPLFQEIALEIPAAQLGKSEAQGLAYRVRRGFPWGRGRASGKLPLIETTGKAPIQDLKLQGIRPHGASDSRVAGGSVEVVEGVEIPAGGKGEVELKLVDFDRAGAFDLGLILDSPSLSAPVIVPIKIHVADAWPLPLLIIVVGVVGAFLIDRVSKRVKAGNKLEKVLSEAARQVEKTMAPYSTTKSDLGKRIKSARRRNRYFLATRKSTLSKAEAIVKELDPSQSDRDSGIRVDKVEDELERTKLTPGAIGLAIVAVLLASLTALNELYLDKPFGTGKDYVGAFLWGFGAHLGLNVLTTLVKSLRSHFSG